MGILSGRRKRQASQGARGERAARSPAVCSLAVKHFSSAECGAGRAVSLGRKALEMRHGDASQGLRAFLPALPGLCSTTGIRGRTSDQQVQCDLLDSLQRTTKMSSVTPHTLAFFQSGRAFLFPGCPSVTEESSKAAPCPRACPASNSPEN